MTTLNRDIDGVSRAKNGERQTDIEEITLPELLRGLDPDLVELLDSAVPVRCSTASIAKDSAELQTACEGLVHAAHTLTDAWLAKHGARTD
jgi:hypothetical protein